MKNIFSTACALTAILAFGLMTSPSFAGKGGGGGGGGNGGAHSGQGDHSHSHHNNPHNGSHDPVTNPKPNQEHEKNPKPSAPVSTSKR